MAGAFQRLIARATGAPTSGLRPRLPTLFEGSVGQNGFEVIQHETPVSEPAHPQTQQAPRARATAPSPQTTDRPIPEAIPSFSKTAQPVPPAPRAAAPVQHPLAAQPQERRPTQPEPAPLLPARPAPQPSFGVHAAERNVTASTTAPVAADRNDQATPETPPPPPLLQPRWPETVTPPEPGAASAASASRTAALFAKHTEPPAPEITIHIGQLDIRSAQAQPIAPQRPAPTTRNLPSLSDYLRGRGS